jgi:hypothetical protein
MTQAASAKLSSSFREHLVIWRDPLVARLFLNTLEARLVPLHCCH